MTIVGENDWLGTAPLFYHEKTGSVSPSLHAVIDLRALEFDPDGLRDYLDLGYCAFGHTPVRHVRFLPPGTRLLRDAAGRLHEEPQPNPVAAWRDRTTEETEVLAALRDSVQEWEKKTSGPIVMPLSGGYDSRLLAACCAEPARLRAFTYGISDRPEQSREVVQAQAIATRLGIPWERVALENFHDRLDDWDALFGPSTHAHGMYHLDFFTQVRARTGPGLPLLTGIVGDAWAGSVPYHPVGGATALPALAYSHGQHARDLPCRLPATHAWRELFWSQHRDALCDPRFQVVEIIRLKMMLLRYLLVVPRTLGFVPWSPFTDASLALAMVCLPPERRAGRRWQQEFFARENLLFPAARATRQNSLDLRTLQRSPPPPLDASRLGELFEPHVVEGINRHLQRPSRWETFLAAHQTGRLGAGIARRLRISNPTASAYAAYLTLRPLEQLLRRRDAA